MESFNECRCLILMTILLFSQIIAQPIDSNLAPVIFPTDNVTVGNGPPPLIFPTTNVTIGNKHIPLVKKEDDDATTGEESELVPLIFPKKSKTVPIIDLPPLIFPDNTTSTNQTALEILNASGMRNDHHTVPLPTSSGENYSDNRSEHTALPHMPLSDYDDNAEVDHPMILKDTHILGIIGAVLAVSCVCFYMGITVWRRVMFNRYGMRKRLINEEE